MENYFNYFTEIEEHFQKARGTGLFLLSTLDWRDFFESVSLIDPILAQDPPGAYPLMDFATRDRYRHIVERIAKRTARPEQEVAQTAVRFTFPHTLSGSLDAVAAAVEASVAAVRSGG